MTKVGDLYEYQRYNMLGERMLDSDDAYPCGYLAKNVFNDTFTLYQTAKVNGGVESSRVSLDNSRNEIRIYNKLERYSPEILHKYSNFPSYVPTGETEMPDPFNLKPSFQHFQWQDTQTTHYIEWLESINSSQPLKFYGEIV